MPMILTRALVALSFLFAALGVHAQSVSIPAAGGATQDFNTLATSGASGTLPQGWLIHESSNDTNYTANDGSSNSGTTYSYGTGTGTERALGGLRSGSNTPTVGARLSNDTGAALTQLRIQYTGEQWRTGARGEVDRLDFQYSVNATSINDAAAAWVDVNALDFIAPVNSGAIDSARDGNAAANRTSLDVTVSGLNVATSATFYVRWSDLSVASNDDGLAIDNVVFGTPIDNPPTVASSVPAHAAIDVAIDTPFSITFSEPVDTIGSWFTFSCGAGTPTLTPSAGPATTFTLTPSGPLGYSKLCNLVVLASQVRDRDGAAEFMAFNHQIQFETMADNLPEVLATTPIDMAAAVGRASNLSVTFSEPVTAPAAAFAVECPVGSARTFALSSDDDTLFVLNPVLDLPASTACRLYVNNLLITDRDGTFENPDRDTLVNFTSAALAPPVVVSTVPAKNATNFPPAGDLQVVFDASVTLSPGAFALSCTQSTGIVLSHANSGASFTIGTGTALIAGDSCTFTIEADAVTSGDGLRPAQDEVVNFTVASTSAATYWQNVNLSSPAQLRCSVHQTIRNHTVGSYTLAWEVVEAGEEDPANPARVLDAYRNCTFLAGATGDRVGGSAGGATCKALDGTTNDPGERYNREHTWPNSLGFGSSSLAAYTDTHMLYATDEGYNATRGNKPYANCPPADGCLEEPTDVNNGVGGGVGTYPGNSNWHSGTSYEVWNHRKGDMARAVMYMAIRYEGGDSVPDLELTDTRALIVGTASTAPTAYMGLLTTLLQWNQFDSPDQRELDRNQIVQTYQNNRNPFIDHPEWASAALFASTQPALCVLNTNAPAANDDSYATPINTPLLVAANAGVLFNDSDAESAPLSAQLASNVLSGTLALAANGGFTYTPANGFCGSTSFTYRASDGVRLSTPRTATIAVGSSCGGNQPPVANDATFGVPENSVATTVVGQVVATDPDVGATLTYSITAGNGSGAFAISASGQISVANASPLNFETTPQFVLTVTVSDGSLSDTAQVTVNLSNVNEAPVANDATFSLPENSAAATVVGTVVASDVDAGTTLGYAITTGNGSGAFAISASGQITVANSAPLNFETTPQFVLTVTASDGNLSDAAQVTINLSNVNEAPVANDATFSVTENSAPATVVGQVVASDVDAGTTLGYAITAGNGSGAFAVSASGQISVASATPLNFETTPQFVLTVTVTDNAAPAAANDAAVITINLSNAEEGPAQAANDATGANEDGGQIAISVLANDTPDPDGGALAVIAVSDPANGTASFTAGGVNYTPDANFCGSDVFNYQITGGVSATITVTVACVNDAPTAIGSLPPRSAQEGVAIVGFSVAGGFSDIDAGDDLDYSQTGLPAGLTLDAETGAISGTPSIGSAAGSVYTVTITATDGESPTQPQQSFQYTVTPVAPSDPHIFGSGFEG